MSMSLREQLLAAGFGKKQAAEQAERKAKEQKRIAQAQAAKAAQAAQAAKAQARAQEVIQRRKEEAERRERWAHIRQLIEQHRLPKIESDDYFNFVARGKVRRLAVDAALRERIISGEVVIVRCEGKHDVVPRDIGERIREYDARAVISLQEKADAAPSEEDPYKDYVVPDDLQW
jgi:uncharacterized protein YaiL (DUF2058 family)